MNNQDWLDLALASQCTSGAMVWLEKRLDW